jgi:hypothetical protein
LQFIFLLTTQGLFYNDATNDIRRRRPSAEFSTARAFEQVETYKQTTFMWGSVNHDQVANYLKKSCKIWDLKQQFKKDIP